MSVFTDAAFPQLEIRSLVAGITVANWHHCHSVTLSASWHHCCLVTSSVSWHHFVLRISKLAFCQCVVQSLHWHCCHCIRSEFKVLSQDVKDSQVADGDCV